MISGDVRSTNEKRLLLQIVSSISIHHLLLISKVDRSRFVPLVVQHDLILSSSTTSNIVTSHIAVLVLCL